MRFLVTKERFSKSWRKLLMGLILFILLFSIIDTILHHYLIGLTPVSASVTLFGDEENFEEPILLSALLLQVHIDCFINMFVLLVLGALYIRLFEYKKRTATEIHLLFLGGLLSPLLLLAAYFSNYLWSVYVWIGMFIFSHLLILYICLKIIWKLR